MDNTDSKRQTEAAREALAKVLVEMGLDCKLPLSRHELPKFRKKAKTTET